MSTYRNTVLFSRNFSATGKCSLPPCAACIHQNNLNFWCIIAFIFVFMPINFKRPKYFVRTYMAADVEFNESYKISGFFVDFGTLYRTQEMYLS